MRKLIPATVLALAALLPLQGAQAQDTLGGALFGGGAGAIIGGAAGGTRGAIIGGVIGAAAGAAIAAHGERRGGYWYYQRGCYMERGDGSYVRVAPRYCAMAEEPAVNDCARYRSYDPVTETYIGRDGRRHRCPY
jgi:hypothetical protein